MNVRLKFRTAVLIVSITLLLGVTICNVAIPKTEATGTPYYIDSKPGSNCSNAGAGTSQAAPWCDFANVGTTDFQPGDRLLLARGAVWSQGMTLQGMGTSANHITVDAYGKGAKPLIDGTSNSSTYGIIMTNPSFWDIANLEIANTGNGIRVEYNTLGHEGLKFSDLEIHGALSSGGGTGIDLWGSPIVTSTSQYALHGLTIENVRITNNKTGIMMRIGEPAKYVDPTITPYPNTLQYVLIRNVLIDDITEAAMVGLNVSNVIVMDTFVNNASQQYAPQGTTEQFFVQTSNVRFVNSIVTNTPDTGSFDMSGFDSEAWNDHISFEGNYFAGHAGTAIEFLALNRQDDYNTNHLVASNAFYGNNVSGSSVYKSSLFYVNDETTYTTSVTGTARDNLYYEPSSFYSVEKGSVAWTFANNLSVAATDMYNAGNDYAGTGNAGGSGCTAGSHCWSYEKYDGSAYSALAYDSANDRWGTSGGYVDRFDLLPTTNASEWIARAWTAPVAGTVSLRGWALKNDTSGGDGVKVRVTRNGTVIWPAGGGSQAIAYDDREGYETKFDSISVNPGDVIRFEVNGGGGGSNVNDMTSWMPTVAYTSR